MNQTKCFQNVKQGNFVYFCKELRANRFIPKLFEPHEICDTRKLSFKRNDMIEFIARKYSTLRERFLINFLWISEVRIIYKINRHWNESVRLIYLAPIFIVLMFSSGT